MNKEQTYSALMSILEKYCPLIEDGVIFFIKNRYVYYINIDPEIKVLQITIRKNFEKSILTEIVSAVTDEDNSDSSCGYYLVEQGTYVYSRTVSLKMLANEKELEDCLKDISEKSELGFKRLTDPKEQKKQDPGEQEIKILINPFTESTTRHVN